MNAPDLSASDPSWTPLIPFWEMIGTRSFVSSDDGDRIRVRYYAGGGRTWARAWFGPGAEGPPGHVHGGALAALLDEAMGMAALATGRVVVAGRIEVDFRAMVPLGTVVTAEVAVEPAVGKKTPVRAVLRGPDGGVVCEATGLFVQISTENLDEAVERVGREAKGGGA
ncbi:PaaI family thioesterase [Rubrivirga sp. S365]|uniref:PaaI family thioesterase n=1 Tax=Rubrivirga sp. S365 TaxID=3076080 RepID=UPI0028C975BB|nr:PaaI family thioesterase [Rubrivirga sp. S365]MDT7857897.1 PaaI family thioesterase [Rubrivirga sp. S365]